MHCAAWLTVIASAPLSPSLLKHLLTWIHSGRLSTRQAGSDPEARQLWGMESASCIKTDKRRQMNMSRVLSGCTLYSLIWPHPLFLWSECQLGFAWLRNSRIVVFCESSKLCLFRRWLKKDVNYDNKEAECETTLLKKRNKHEKQIISWHKITVPVCFVLFHGHFLQP